MSRTRNAVVSAVFTYTQYAIALTSGFVLFPLTVWYLGAYDIGLWLITGELVGYLLLSDLGVFAVLPWLVAAKDGMSDRAGIARYTADALCVGVVVGTGIVVAAGVVWASDPTALGVAVRDWNQIRKPLTLVLALTGIGFPLRAFTAVLAGLQDVTFLGVVNLTQACLAIGLTATLIPLGYGLGGLAVAAGIPPMLGGIAAMVRTLTRHSDVVVNGHRPQWRGCHQLLVEGFGAWLGGLGVRLLTASSGLVFASLGRPDWATVYAATGKVAQVLQPLCLALPDSALVGLGQHHGAQTGARTRQVVICLLILYFVFAGGTCLVVLVANPGFVRLWLGPDIYGGDYTSGLLAANVIVGSVVGGLFKVVGVTGYRLRIGLATISYGAAAVGIGWLLVRVRGIAGFAEGTLLAGTLTAIPYGLLACKAAYGVGLRDVLRVVGGGRLVPTAALLVVGAWVGVHLASHSVIGLLLVTSGFAFAYAVLLRPVLDNAPWPPHIRERLARVGLVSAHSPLVHHDNRDERQ